jgi:hypothetical protein
VQNSVSDEVSEIAAFAKGPKQASVANLLKIFF